MSLVFIALVSRSTAGCGTDPFPEEGKGLPLWWKRNDVIEAFPLDASHIGWVCLQCWLLGREGGITHVDCPSFGCSVEVGIRNGLFLALLLWNYKEIAPMETESSIRSPHPEEIPHSKFHCASRFVEKSLCLLWAGQRLCHVGS